MPQTKPEHYELKPMGIRAAPDTMSVIDLPLPLDLITEIPMTDKEFLELWDANEDLYMERDASGWIHVMPIPGHRVNSAQLEMGDELLRWAERDGRGQLFARSGFALQDGSILGASIVWMLYESWHSLSRDQQTGFAPRCPDFVIELLSPFDNLTRLRAKMDLWVANGAQSAWLVDLDRQVVEVFSRDCAVHVYERPAIVHGTGIVSGLIVAMDRVWAKSIRGRNSIEQTETI